MVHDTFLRFIVVYIRYSLPLNNDFMQANLFH